MFRNKWIFFFNGQGSIFKLAIVILLVFCSYESGAVPSVDSLQTVLAQNIPDSQRVNMLIKLSASADKDNNPDNLVYASAAESLARKDDWVPGIIAANIELGNIYVIKKNYTAAIQYFSQAEAAGNNSDSTEEEIILLRNLGYCYNRIGQYKKAIDYYTQEIALNPKTDEEMSAWGNLGSSYNDIGDYPRSLNAYYNSLRLLNTYHGIKKISDKQDSVQMAALLVNIGYVYIAMNEHGKAVMNFDSVYKTGIAIHDRQVQMLGLMGLAETYAREKDYERSIGLYYHALQECDSVKDIKDEVPILNKLAAAYLAKSDITDANDYAQRAMRLAEEHDNKEQLPKVYITVGKIALQQKLYTDAADYLRKSLAISGTTGALEDQKDAWLALSATFEHTGQTANAFDAYRQYIAIRDSIYNIDKLNLFARQELDFAYQSKSLADKLTYDKRIARQQILTYSVFGGLVLVLLLVFFIYRNYHTQRKYNILLNKEHERQLAHIEAQDSVLTDIAHIQSHEVRGPVATILGLVQIFNYDDPEDPVNKEIMEGLASVTQKLDIVVKEVILKENNLKHMQKQGKGKKSSG